MVLSQGTAIKCQMGSSLGEGSYYFMRGVNVELSCCFVHPKLIKKEKKEINTHLAYTYQESIGKKC